MMKFLSASCLLLLLLLTGPTTAQPGALMSSYVRQQKTAPAQFETSVVRMQGAAGQTLDLVSAVHVGEAGYYQELNTRFQHYDAVLYELILPEEVAGQRLPSKMEGGGTLSTFQGMMARTLGLTTQLDQIDYSPAHFVHADLTQEALARSMAARNESVWSYFQKVLADAGSSNASPDLGVSDQEFAQLDFMAIFSGMPSPRDRRTLRKIMASTLSGGGAGMGAMDDTALLADRNTAALKVLDAQLGAGKRKLALFYGAAHMPDLELKLRKKGWKRGETTWLKAWSL